MPLDEDAERKKWEQAYENVKNLNGGRGASPDRNDGTTQIKPLPLQRPPIAAEPYPVAALGPKLTPAVAAIHEKIGAPPAIIANSVLATATLAVQPFADIQLPTGQRYPISDYFASIAETGERKSASDEDAMTSVRTYENQLAETYEWLQREHQQSLAAWTKQRDQILNDKSRNPNITEKKVALALIGAEPEPPLLPMLITTEPTLEGLYRHFREGRPSLGLVNDEGGQFVGGHAMQEDTWLRTAAGLSHLWDGKPIRRSRGGEGNYALYGRRLTTHLLMQPRVADRLFANPDLVDQGLLTRVLAVRPESASGTRVFHKISPENFSALSRFSGNIGAILQKPVPLAEGKRNQLAPRTLTLDSEAEMLWIRFVDDVEAEMKPGRAWETIRGLANKLGNHAARLATVLTLINDLNATTVAANTLADAIVLARYYAGEALRIRDASQVNADLALAERLLGWLLTEWREKESDNRLVSLPDIYQFGPRPIRDRETAQKLIAILEDHGWLQRVEPARINGVPRREVWSIAKVTL
jgi:hypothetical protein